MTAKLKLKKPEELGKADLNEVLFPSVEQPFTLNTIRFMFNDGKTLDVITPHNNSDVNKYALEQAVKLWGERKDRSIVGVARMKGSK